MDQLVGGCLDRRVDGTGGLVVAWKDGWNRWVLVAWIDGWMDGWIRWVGDCLDRWMDQLGWWLLG